MSSAIIDGVRLESPLVARSAERAVLALSDTIVRERPFLGHINLRGDPSDAAFRDAVARVIGTGLPLRANTCSEASGRTIYWLCPNEWLVVCAGADEPTL
ncbi:MAG TPA: sarcosine oxidase subunit gamma family protein, partial [Casimicrobiaceae bacterium]|nr:sarcosine oxidase subunit gamma family protein [Casimicrobiaceae bacterium]